MLESARDHSLLAEKDYNKEKWASRIVYVPEWLQGMVKK